MKKKIIALLALPLFLASCGGGGGNEPAVDFSGYGESADKAFNVSQAVAALKDDYKKKGYDYGAISGVFLKGIVVRSVMYDVINGPNPYWMGTLVLKEEGKENGPLVTVSVSDATQEAKDLYFKNQDRLFNFDPDSMIGYEVVLDGDFQSGLRGDYALDGAHLYSFSRSQVEKLPGPNLVRCTYNCRYFPSAYKEDASMSALRNASQGTYASCTYDDKTGDNTLVWAGRTTGKAITKVVVTMNTLETPKISYYSLKDYSDYSQEPTYTPVTYGDYQAVIDIPTGAYEVHIMITSETGIKGHTASQIGFELKAINS